MPGLLPGVDPDGLLEYSVVYTDRALNHMSQSFQHVMNDVSAMLKDTYNARCAAIVPGSGTFGMEAVARQFANGRRCLVIRNGFFSYRWSQILEMGRISDNVTVLQARPASDATPAPFAPAPIEAVEQAIAEQKPEVVFAPHVETSAGMVLPEDYLRRLASAVRAEGGLFVLDCIASGAAWIDMTDIGVDVLVSAPQKGWSGTPCCGLVMLGERACDIVHDTTSTSFACDLGKWLQIMEAYEAGGHAYHATMPTDGIRTLRQVMLETRDMGLDKAQQAQWELGTRVRELLASRGFASVAADGFGAPGVVVSYTDDPDIKSGAKFAQSGLQIAAGVPLMCDEPQDFSTFRIGLFGLDKLQNVDRTADSLRTALDKLI
ncbi:MAG: aminotransferase [Gammaproteobacteria bacterium]|nr:aminotransferase [Gammaproteobacteria bacterium]